MRKTPNVLKTTKSTVLEADQFKRVKIITYYRTDTTNKHKISENPEAYRDKCRKLYY